MEKNLNRVLGGLKSKSNGAGFENRLREYVDYQVPNGYALRIHDGARRIGFDKLIPVKQACDFVIVIDGKTIFIDTKSTHQSGYSAPINSHQINELRNTRRCGCRAGYLVEFQKSLSILWYPIEKLIELTRGKSSIYLKRSDGLQVGETLPMRIDFEKILAAQ